MGSAIPAPRRHRSTLIRDVYLAVAIGTAMLTISLITPSLLVDLNDERQVIKECSIDVQTPDGLRMATISHSSLFGVRAYFGSLSKWNRARVQEHGMEVGDHGFAGIPTWVLRGPLQWVEQGGPQPPRARIVVAIGWPMSCLWYELRGWYPNDGSLPAWYTSGGLKLADRASDPSGRAPMPIVIPLRPLLGPLAFNLVFYIVTACVVRVGFRHTRCFIRRRRGLCPACAYDLRATPASSPCPECGYISKHRQTPASRL